MGEKKEKKKRHLAAKILRWLFIGLLGVLLLLAVIFSAPSKLITLLCIFLAACTVLPRPARKWFWVSVGVVVLALVVWVFLPDDTEGWRPYTFDDELAALEAKYAVPDDENAAMIYNRLLEGYDPNLFEIDFAAYDLQDLTRHEPWSSKEYPQLARWLKGHENTIAELIKASKIEESQFPIVADPTRCRESIRILMPMHNWAQLLIRAANNDLAENQIDQAWEKYTAALQMAKHLCQQPRMADLSVGLQLETLAVQSLNRFIVSESATEAHLNFIEETLRAIKHNWSSDYSRILEYEKLHTKNMWCMAYEVSPNDKIRLSRDPVAALWEPSDGMHRLPYWKKRLLKANTVLSWFYMPSNPQKVAEVIDAGYETLYAMPKLDFDRQKTPRELSFSSVYSIPIKLSYLARVPNYSLINAILNVSEHTYHLFHDQCLQITGVHRSSLLLVALRYYKNQNGHWPKSLDDAKPFAPPELFVDPINGSSFVYRLTEDNFTLYSKGKNTIDEQGGSDGGADDFVIWPPKTEPKRQRGFKANDIEWSTRNQRD